MPHAPWYYQLPAILVRHAVIKAIGIMAFIAVFMLIYLQLLKTPRVPVTEMPLLWLDHAISFQPHALPMYLTLWLYVSLPPALLTGLPELKHYVVSIAAVCLIGLACFLIWPNAVPPVMVDWASYPGVAFLRDVDAAGNACPSLHVATATFSALWIDRRLRELGAGPVVRWGNWLWCLAIAWSTMAIKQHVALDVLAGFVLGLGGALVSLRGRARRDCGPAGQVASTR